MYTLVVKYTSQYYLMICVRFFNLSLNNHPVLFLLFSFMLPLEISQNLP